MMVNLIAMYKIYKMRKKSHAGGQEKNIIPALQYVCAGAVSQ
jgi:hypothetical protein